MKAKKIIRTKRQDSRRIVLSRQLKHVSKQEILFKKILISIIL